MTNILHPRLEEALEVFKDKNILISKNQKKEFSDLLYDLDRATNAINKFIADLETPRIILK